MTYGHMYYILMKNTQNKYIQSIPCVKSYFSFFLATFRNVVILVFNVIINCC